MAANPAASQPTPIGPDVIGRFSFLALYPFDTQVILRIPPRWSLQGSGARDTPERLRDLLNQDRLTVKPKPGAPPLTFGVEPLGDIFTDSPNATWSALGADLPGEWFRPALQQGHLPAAVELSSVGARLFLFDGGIAVLALEVGFVLQKPDEYEETFPDMVKQTAEQTARYENEALTSFCRSLLNGFGVALQDAVTDRGIAGKGEIRGSYRTFVDRIRTISVPEAYPTIVTKIWGRQGFKPSRYDLGFRPHAGDVPRRLGAQERAPKLRG